MLIINKVRSKEDFEHSQRLFEEYSVWCRDNFLKHRYLPKDSPKLENFNDEQLSRRYNSHLSYVLLAKWNGKPAGITSVKYRDALHCEMKRLYVNKQFRSKNVGMGLINSLMANARQTGYRYIWICSHSRFMGKAISIYKNMGFYKIPNFERDPLQSGDVQMELELKEI